MRVAIIGGSGKMGRWLANFLRREGKAVVITGRNETKLLEVKERLGVEVSTSLKAISNADLVLISVPIDSFAEVVRQLPPFLNSRQVIMDITSVKLFPVETMHRYIKTGLVLGTHPMFGPGASDIVNKNVVLTPTDDRETALAQKTKTYLEERGGKVTLMTPREHDEMMSVVLGLSHFIAIVAADTLLTFDNLKQMERIAGSTYRVLLTLAEGVLAEDPDFYASLQVHLPRMAEIEELFTRNSEKWAGIVKDRDGAKFAAGMKALKGRLAKSNPDFKRAYENMYRLLES